MRFINTLFGLEDDILSEIQWELGDDEPDIHDDWLAAASPMRACLA